MNRAVSPRRNLLAWLVDLRQTGVVPTPVPVAGKDGEQIQLVGHARLARPRNVVLWQWETGSEPGIGESLAEPFELLGEVTARMHIHSRQWKRPSWFSRHVWDFETSLGEESPHWGRWRDGMGVDAADYEKDMELFRASLEFVGKTR